MRLAHRLCQNMSLKELILVIEFKNSSFAFYKSHYTALLKSSQKKFPLQSPKPPVYLSLNVFIKKRSDKTQQNKEC